MLTCCPACRTTFRVTPEQLKARAGKVRCGKCQAVFNALDTLADAASAAEFTAAMATAAAATAPAAASPAAADSADSADAAPAVPAAEERRDDAAFSGETVDILLDSTAIVDLTTDAGTPAGTAPEAATETGSPLPAAVRDTALAAGLVAARETTEMPGYSKWAAGTLAAPVSVAEPAARPLWPFVLATTLLLLALAVQVGHHFRTEIAVASPGLRPVLAAACAWLDCAIPLPRNSELVSIESSDLQIDPAHNGTLTLSATLKNRAAYAQAWPLLEITLTDVQDNALLRRVLQPADYLPPKSDPTVFPPNGEASLHLSLAVRDLTASGYRLYVFYP